MGMACPAISVPAAMRENCALVRRSMEFRDTRKKFSKTDQLASLSGLGGHLNSYSLIASPWGPS